MAKVNFELLKKRLLDYEKEIIILSIDYDERFFEAVKKLHKLVPNIKYLQVNEEFISNFDKVKKDQLFNFYKELRIGRDDEKLLQENFKKPNYFATLLLKGGYANGIVSGANYPTAHILKPAFQIVKQIDKNEPISSFMWLYKDNHYDMFMADVSVNPNPNANQLAAIAIQTANSVKDIFNIKPVVAMLSFSTLGSGGKQPDVLKIQEATAIVKKAGIEVIGEIQWDAAYNQKTFDLKTKGQKLSKLPNVFVFPDLNSGNIGYKITTTIGNFKAIGPLLQNIKLPVNDLSRGCNADEIVDLVIITALQWLDSQKK